MYRRIVVPLDGSEIAQGALTHARDMARLYEATLFLVRVTDAPIMVATPGGGTGGSTSTLAVGVVGQQATPDEDRQARDYIDGMTRQLQSEGFRASGTVVTGRAADGIVSTLNESDLLVMSSHGRTGIKRLFLGSVAERVLKKSSNSVFIVRS